MCDRIKIPNLLIGGHSHGQKEEHLEPELKQERLCISGIDEDASREVGHQRTYLKFSY